MVTRITRISLAKLIFVLPIASLVFPALAQNVTPNMTEFPRLAIGGYDTPRLAQMNDKAEWRCMYAGQAYSDGANVCETNGGYIQTCQKGTWARTNRKC